MTPHSALFDKPGASYNWDVRLVAARGGWRYRGPSGWRTKIGTTPAEAWRLAVAHLAEGGWTPLPDPRGDKDPVTLALAALDAALAVPDRDPRTVRQARIGYQRAVRDARKETLRLLLGAAAC